MLLGASLDFALHRLMTPLPLTQKTLHRQICGRYRRPSLKYVRYQTVPR